MNKKKLYFTFEKIYLSWGCGYMKKLLLFVTLLSFFISSFAVTITMTAGAVGKELELTNIQIQRFMEENPDINVQILPMPNSSTARHDLYVTYLASGTPDPVVLMLDVVWPAEFAPFLVDLKPDYDYFAFDGFLEGTIKSNVVDDKIVAAPWFTDAGFMYYRKDLLEKYGYDAPNTWSELYNIAKDISENEFIDGFVWQGAKYEGLTCDVMEFVHSFGGEIIDNGKVVVDNAENYDKTVAALKFMKKLIDDGVTPKGVTTYMEEESRRQFQNGNAVFMRNWPYAWPLANASDSPVKGKVGIVPVPMGDNGRHSATLGGWNLGINKNSSKAQIDAAKKLVKYLTAYDQQVERATYAGQNPTMKSAYSDAKIKEEAPFVVDLYDVFISAEPRPVTAVYSEVSDAIQRYTYGVLTGQYKAEDAVTRMAKELKQIVGN